MCDGVVGWLVVQERPDVAVTSLEVRARSGACIPVQPFDGRAIPFVDRNFTTVLVVNVLYHAEDPGTLLAEAGRVAGTVVIVKEHVRTGVLASATLRFMDRVGNLCHGVVVPGVCWDHRRWVEEFRRAGLEVQAWHGWLGLHRWPASMFFQRRLHFLAVLEPCREVTQQRAMV